MKRNPFRRIWYLTIQMGQELDISGADNFPIRVRWGGVEEGVSIDLDFEQLTMAQS